MKRHSDAETFLSAEHGAVTVDWVVLTGALVGLGLAVSATVSRGVQDASEDVDAQLRSTPIFTAFASTSAEDFSGGIGDFVGGTVTELTNWGAALLLDRSRTGAQTASLTVDVPSGATKAVVTFDLLSMDSVDGHSGEGAYLYLDDRVVARMTDTHGGEPTWEMVEGSGVTVSYETVSYGSDLTGPSNAAFGSSDSRSHDAHTRVTMTVDDPTAAMTVGFGARLDQGTADESIAIDNVSVATDGYGA